MSLGAVLAQKKTDGKVYPVKFASRAMTRAQKMCCICKRETVAIVLYLKKFRTEVHCS